MTTTATAATRAVGRTAADRVTGPNGLPLDAVSAVSDTLNKVLADTFAVYLKTKNFHWHVSGPHFRDYHILFDEQAAQILASTDELAERIRKIGGSTLRSIGHIARLQRIQDNDRDFVPATEMLRELTADNRALAKALREAHEVADERRDVATASLLENLIDEAEKRAWFLSEASRT
jgi:starvation-inducible DNA-binding protein